MSASLPEPLWLQLREALADLLLAELDDEDRGRLPAPPQRPAKGHRAQRLRMNVKASPSKTRALPRLR